MFFNSIKKLVLRYHPLIAVVITVSVVQSLELVLLHYKYNIFTGGFLQPFSYNTTTDRFVFIILSLWFDLSFFVFMASCWYFFAKKLDKVNIIASYNFTVISILLMGIFFAFKYKVLSYFSDAVNFEIIKNLGGGSLREALLYASNEIAIFSGALLIIVFCIILTVKFLIKFKFVHEFSYREITPPFFIYLVILILVLTPLITWIVSENEFLRYGLEKKTSFRIISKVLDKLSDMDLDGYGSFSYPKDKAVLIADVFPGAMDFPGNGIDEDGFLGDAVVPDIGKDRLAEITPENGKHIILIVLESARVDLLEKKLKGEYVAPVMREIASIGSFIGYAYSHTGYTTTSIRALFNRDLITNKNKVSLIELLQDSGYQISIISGQDESFGDVASEVGMKNDGVHYFDARTAIEDRVFVSKEPGSLRLSEERVIEQFKVQFNKLDFTKPQFIYLNFQAAHFPYSHPKMKKRIVNDLIPRSEINLENKEWVSATYWNAIANADWAVGEVLNLLKQHQMLHEVTLVIVGDHGESLFDDGFLGHGHAINDSQTWIPLIINDPDIIVDEAIGQVDIAEIIVRSAFGLENRWTNKDKVVFQLVGDLFRPALVAHVKQGGARTIFDFSSEQVYFSELQLWMPYEKALKDPQYKNRVENLIRNWEALRWRAYQAKH